MAKDFGHVGAIYLGFQKPVDEKSTVDSRVEAMLTALEATEGVFGPIGYGSTFKLGVVFIVDQPTPKTSTWSGHRISPKCSVSAVSASTSCLSARTFRRGSALWRAVRSGIGA